MADGYVQLQDDTLLTGKKVRTQSRTVSGSTVHEHYFIEVDEVAGTAQTYTDENGDHAKDIHVSNTTIEKTIGSAIGTLVLLQGVSDGTNARAARAYTDGRLQVANYTGTFADTQVSIGTGVAAQIPASPPSVPYRLTFSAEAASTAAFNWRGTTGTTLGHRFYALQTIVFEMGASKALFVYHDSGSSQNINITVEPID